MASIHTAFTLALLNEAVKRVRLHFPDVRVRKDAWVYCFGRDHWEFHGPDNFYWNGNAHNAYETRYKGWMAWLKHKGIDLDSEEA